jgi:hypothetical protein
MHGIIFALESDPRSKKRVSGGRILKQTQKNKKKKLTTGKNRLSVESRVFALFNCDTYGWDS